MKLKHIMALAIGCGSMLLTLPACSDEQQFTDNNTDAKRIEVQHITPEMAKVRDYVPLYAVVAHRGSTFWAPEETEAAWRWAREMGADYLESDMQATNPGQSRRKPQAHYQHCQCVLRICASLTQGLLSQL